MIALSKPRFTSTLPQWPPGHGDRVLNESRYTLRQTYSDRAELTVKHLCSSCCLFRFILWMNFMQRTYTHKIFPPRGLGRYYRRSCSFQLVYRCFAHKFHDARRPAASGDSKRICVLLTQQGWRLFVFSAGWPSWLGPMQTFQHTSRVLWHGIFPTCPPGRSID